MKNNFMPDDNEEKLAESIADFVEKSSGTKLPKWQKEIIKTISDPKRVLKLRRKRVK